MIRSDGRVIEWHCVRAVPRTTAAGKTKAKAKALDAAVLATGSAKPKAKRPTAKTAKQKLRSKLYNLALDISTLRQQIHNLYETRTLLYTRALYTRFDGDGSHVQRTQAFVELTRPGESLDEPHTMAKFLSAVSEDITFGPYVGRDQLVTTWREFARRLRTTRLVIDGIRVVSIEPETETCTVRLDSTIWSTITMGALEAFYPAVLKDAELTRVLLGQSIVLPNVARITFGHTNQIIQYEVELDLVGVLTQLTTDARRASELLEEAAREKKGLPYLSLEADEIKEAQTMPAPRVETLWGIDREPECQDDGKDTRQDRYAVDFLLT